MKKVVLVIGIVAVVLVCILAAGCTGTTTTQKVEQTTVSISPGILTGEPIVGEWTLNVTNGWAGNMDSKNKVPVIVKVTEDGKVIFTEMGKSTPLATGIVADIDKSDSKNNIVYNIRSNTNGLDDIWLKYYVGNKKVLASIHDTVHKTYCSMMD